MLEAGASAALPWPVMSAGKILVYLLRHDLRVSDNPVLHHLATSTDHGFSNLLPVYVFPHKQIEVSGLLKDPKEKSPYPPAVSEVGKFWRCGPHRAKFIAQSVWQLKEGLEEVDSGLTIRAGEMSDIVGRLITHFKGQPTRIGAVWMLEEKSSEEVQEQNDVAATCGKHDVDFKLWSDNKYLINDEDTGLESLEDLPDVFTTYRKSQEPVREKPRAVLPKPQKSTIPPLPSSIPEQHSPFAIPHTVGELETNLLKPLDHMLDQPPAYPDGASSAHPFKGGEQRANERLRYLITAGLMSTYDETRNGLLGPDFSTKLSAYLALGCITAPQIHNELLKLEDGTDKAYADVKGYGQGENGGTKSVRFELLWRDYMRLCTAKFGRKLFRLSGFRNDGSYAKKWNSANKELARSDQDTPAAEVDRILKRFLEGTTGMGLIDAAQRELFHTGYTSNRARQNAASFLAKHLDVDWRYGAEWYEMMLVDYDVSSNWCNWQYVAGVGNDPRGDARIFNPVKQAFDYDKEGAYVRTWVPEFKALEKPENVFQPWTTSSDELAKLGLADNIMVTDPIKKIEFMVDRKPKGSRRPFARKRGQGRGGGNGGTGRRGGQSGDPGVPPLDGMAAAAPVAYGAGLASPIFQDGIMHSYPQHGITPGPVYGGPQGPFPGVYGPAGWVPDPSGAGRGGNDFYRGRGRGAYRGSYEGPYNAGHAPVYPQHYQMPYSPGYGPPPPGPGGPLGPTQHPPRQ